MSIKSTHILHAKVSIIIDIGKLFHAFLMIIIAFSPKQLLISIIFFYAIIDKIYRINITYLKTKIYRQNFFAISKIFCNFAPVLT